MRGVWQHQKLKYPERPHLRYKRVCHHWNYYISYNYKNDNQRTPPFKVQIDVKCQGCGERVRFNPFRMNNGGQGKVRQVKFVKRPDHMPKYALRKEAEARNTIAKNDKEMKA